MKGVNRMKLIFLQSSLNHKQGGHGFNTSFSILLSHHHYYRRWLVAVLSFFTVASLLALMLKASNSRGVDTHASSISLPAGEEEKPLPAEIFDALVEYVTSSNSSEKMEKEDMQAVTGVLRLRAPCNLLVFGIRHETPLWRALNHGGPTVITDESEYLVGRAEGMNLGLEAYDMAFTTMVRETPELLVAARRQRHRDCRRRSFGGGMVVRDRDLWQRCRRWRRLGWSEKAEAMGAMRAEEASAGEWWGGGGSGGGRVETRKGFGRDLLND